MVTKLLTYEVDFFVTKSLCKFEDDGFLQEIAKMMLLPEFSLITLVKVCINFQFGTFENFRGPLLLKQETGRDLCTDSIVVKFCIKVLTKKEGINVCQVTQFFAIFFKI